MDDHPAERCSAERSREQLSERCYTGNTAIQPYTAIHGYTAIQLLSWESSPEEWSELDLPHSRPRACARVTMRTRMMRARARVRAPARGDTP